MQPHPVHLAGSSISLASPTCAETPVSIIPRQHDGDCSPTFAPLPFPDYQLGERQSFPAENPNPHLRAVTSEGVVTSEERRRDATLTSRRGQGDGAVTESCLLPPTPPTAVYGSPQGSVTGCYLVSGVSIATATVTCPGRATNRAFWSAGSGVGRGP